MSIKGVDITGLRFGRLVVLGKSQIPGKWICKCDCGNIVEVYKANLLKPNHTTSCGCYLREIAGNLTKTHGESKTRLYLVYRSMITRCHLTTDKNYKNYGAKGIKVCDEWKNKENGYVNFRNWAYATGYDPNAPRGVCTLERIDRLKDYCPENCRWVSNDVQAKNKSINVKYPFNGADHTISEIAIATGVPYGTLVARFGKYHWPLERAIVPPLGYLTSAIYFEDDYGYIIHDGSDYITDKDEE